MIKEITKRNYGIFIIPIHSIQCKLESPIELYSNKGLTISILKFDKELKRKVLGIKILNKNDSFPFVWEPVKSNANTDSIIAECCIRFVCNPINEFRPDFKSYDFTNLLLSICLIGLKVAPRDIHFDFDDKKGSFGSIRGVKTYMNRSYADLSAKNIELFRKLCTECFNNYSKQKKAITLLSLFEMTQVKGTIIGLRCALYVTILESFFAPDNPELKYKFSMRLTKYLKGDKKELKFFSDMYKYRSKFYHQGLNKFSSNDEIKLCSISRILICKYIIDNDVINITEIDNQMLF